MSNTSAGGRRALTVGVGISGMAMALRLRQIRRTPVIMDRWARRTGTAAPNIPDQNTFTRIAQSSGAAQIKDRDIVTAADTAADGTTDAFARGSSDGARRTVGTYQR